MTTADSASVQQTPGPAATPTGAPVFAAGVDDVPAMPDVAATAADPATLQALRQFHFTGQAERLATIEPGSVLPALLFPFRDPSRVRADYPLFLDADPTPEQPPCRSLGAVLRQAMIDAGAGQVLIDNRTRLELCIRRSLGAATTPQVAREVVTRAAAELREQLQLRGDSAERLDRDLQGMVEHLPQAGDVLTASVMAPIHLFIAAARQTLRRRRAVFSEQVARLCAELENLVAVERGKDTDAHDAAHLGDAVGPAGANLLDPGRLAEVVGGHRGSRVMRPELRQLIEASLQRLREFLAADRTTTVCVLGPSIEPLTDADDVVWHDVADVCTAGATQFDAVAHEWAEVFRAVRRARLVQNPDYDPDRHDAWADTFGWESFSDAELHLLPCILAVELRPGIATDTLPELSRLLLSGRRVHVLLAQDPVRDPTTGEATGTSFRLELAYLAMAHREAFVQQASAARPDHLQAGFLQAILGTRTALSVIDNEAPAAIGTWLHSRAAIEARAHPLFRYDPDAGRSWARRLDFDGNPASGDDWSAQAFAYRAASSQQMQLAFTYADLCLLDRAQAGAFLSIPRGLQCDDLIELPAYLELDEDQAMHRLPFLWAVDQNGELRRLLITNRLVAATRERLGFWRTLQDLAGVRSETVDRAIAAAEAEAADRFAAEKQQLIASHDAELVQLRNAATTDAMQGLAQMLLDTDIGSLADVTVAPAASPSAPITTADQAPAAPETAPPAADPIDDEDDEVDAEPWVETVLCTSCNDCVTINPRLFVYDENKQVYLGDAKAGTYKHLVEAAEKCPARCIHPGQPLDPSEPGLAQLTERAAPFN